MTGPPYSERILGMHALSSRVLIVAIQRIEGWCAYCDAVPGISHHQEINEVLRSGAKLPKFIAQALFTGEGPYIA